MASEPDAVETLEESFIRLAAIAIVSRKWPSRPYGAKARENSIKAASQDMLVAFETWRFHGLLGLLSIEPAAPAPLDREAVEMALTTYEDAAIRYGELDDGEAEIMLDQARAEVRALLFPDGDGR